MTYDHQSENHQPENRESKGKHTKFRKSRRAFLGQTSLFAAASVVSGFVGSQFSSKTGGDAAIAQSLTAENATTQNCL
ncbi:MAG: hypothetical protein HC772_18415, partial [Leptolyngbyaceae cyanobacterium CRU_2_3]|nr:hypothetical protein [Leptolyngbyaceae cyanobacterium CRU_2_3]